MSAAATLQRTDVAARAVEATTAPHGRPTASVPRRMSWCAYGAGPSATASPSLAWGDTAVIALDEVTVEFPTGRFTAIMGPRARASRP